MIYKDSLPIFVKYQLYLKGLKGYFLMSNNILYHIQDTYGKCTFSFRV